MLYDELWPGGLKFIRSSAVFAIGTDAVLLSGFADIKNVRRAMDIGAGSGIISLLMAYGKDSITIDAVEIQESAAITANENAKLNGLDGKINIIHGDIRDFRSMEGSGTYDLVVSNPPYFPVNSGRTADSESAAFAREERHLNLSELCAAAAYFTRWGGKFSLVHRPERLCEVFCRLSENGLEPKLLRFVHDKEGLPPCLVLVESRRGGKPGLKIASPLIIRGDDGAFTPEVMEIYHRKD